MKRAALVLSLMTAAASAAAPATRPAAAASARLYAVSLSVTEAKDGQTRTLAEPVLVVRDGQDGSFLSGGELATADEFAGAEIGLRARVCVREKGDKLRVSLSVQGTDVGTQSDSGYVLRRSGAQGELLVRPGDTFVMDMGAGRSARVCVLAAGR